MFVHNLNPVIFEIGSLQIRWYGLLYLLGFITTYFYLRIITKRKLIFNMNPKDVEDFLIGMIISLVVGARLFHVFVYNPVYYFSRPLEIFMIWRGGLSFHGALVLIALWIYYYSKKKKIVFLQLTDYLVFPAAVFLALGRLANFINAELVGKITNAPWGVQFNTTSYEGFRHPTQIYEAIKNIFIFGILLSVKTLQMQVFRKSTPGILTAIFLIGYGSLRFFIEFLKESTIVLLGLNMGQILSIATLLFGIYMLKIMIKTRNEFYRKK